MIKFFKICIVFLIILFLTINYVYSVNMNLTENEIVINDDNSISENFTNTNAAGSSYSTITTYDSNELSLENILCILLLVVGFLLILLGIAIFIRIKK